MYKQTTFVLTAAILLTAIVSLALYTIKAANAQGNMTNATSGAAKNMTGAVGGAMGAAKSAIGGAISGAGK